MNVGGNLVNTATVHTDRTGEQHSDATTAVDQNPSLSIVKSTADLHVDHAGQLISYTIDVDNTGNIALSGVTLAVTSCAVSGATLASGDTDGDHVLDVNETW